MRFIKVSAAVIVLFASAGFAAAPAADAATQEVQIAQLGSISGAGGTLAP